MIPYNTGSGNVRFNSKMVQLNSTYFQMTYIDNTGLINFIQSNF